MCRHAPLPAGLWRDGALHAAMCARLRAVYRPTGLSTWTTTRVRIGASPRSGWRMPIYVFVGSYGTERVMGVAFVKIGARYINLSAILWVDVHEEKPEF